MATSTSDRWRRLTAGVFSALVLTTIGLSGTASASGTTSTYQYAEGNWNMSAPSGVLRTASVRLAPGEERPGATTRKVLEGEVSVKLCIGSKLVTVAGSLQGAPSGFVSVRARDGRASVDADARLNGTIKVQNAGWNCGRPSGAVQTLPYSTHIEVEADWRNARNSTPVEYSGAACGGTGTCYYRDARATASLEILGVDLPLGSSSSGFFWRGDYPA